LFVLLKQSVFLEIVCKQLLFGVNALKTNHSKPIMSAPLNKTMNEQIQIISTEWGLIFDPVSGFELNDHNIFSVIDFALDNCKEKKKSRLLFDETNIKRKLSCAKIIDAVEHFRRYSENSGVYRLAFVLQGNYDRTDLRFVENVGYNRGIRIEHFYDKNKAIEWLKSKDISPADK